MSLNRVAKDGRQSLEALNDTLEIEGWVEGREDPTESEGVVKPDDDADKPDAEDGDCEPSPCVAYASA
jgi:hypothetical protein